MSGNFIAISLNSTFLTGFCVPIAVPFSKTVVVAPLAPGAYSVGATLYGNGAFMGQFSPVGFSVPTATDIPAASLLTLLALGAGLVLLRYRFARAG
jgi:hypothetical protein